MVARTVLAYGGASVMDKMTRSDSIIIGVLVVITMLALLYPWVA